MNAEQRERIHRESAKIGHNDEARLAHVAKHLHRMAIDGDDAGRVAQVQVRVRVRRALSGDFQLSSRNFSLRGGLTAPQVTFEASRV